MRQAGTWDPLLLQCSSACTWTYLSLSNKIQRNYMGLKIAVCMHGWGKLEQKDTKDKTKNQLPHLKSLEQNAGFWEQKHSTERVLCTQYPKRMGKPPKHSSKLVLDTPQLSLHIRNKLTLLSRSEQARENVVCSCSSLLQEGLQYSLVWISCLGSSQFLLIGGGQELHCLSMRMILKLTWCMGHTATLSQTYYNNRYMSQDVFGCKEWKISTLISSDNKQILYTWSWA